MLFFSSQRLESTCGGSDSYPRTVRMSRQDFPRPVTAMPVTLFRDDIAFSSLMTWSLWDMVRVR